MSILKKVQENCGKAALPVSVFAMSVLAPVVTHAAEAPDMTTMLTTSVQSIVTNTLSAISAVAPIGITIFASMFVWKKGLKFFKQTTNN